MLTVFVTTGVQLQQRGAGTRVDGGRGRGGAEPPLMTSPPQQPSPQTHHAPGWVCLSLGRGVRGGALF